MKSREEKSRREKEKKLEECRYKRAKCVRKAAKQCVFPMICVLGGTESMLAKAAGAEPPGQMRH